MAIWPSGSSRPTVSGTGRITKSNLSVKSLQLPEREVKKASLAQRRKEAAKAGQVQRQEALRASQAQRQKALKVNQARRQEAVRVSLRCRKEAVKVSRARRQEAVKGSQAHRPLRRRVGAQGHNARSRRLPLGRQAVVLGNGARAHGSAEGD